MGKLPRRPFRALRTESLEKRMCLATTVSNVLNLDTNNLWQDIREVTPSGNHVYFVASTPGLQDLELWRMGANQSSAVRLTTLGPDDRKPRELTDVNGTLYFKGHTPTTGFELWKSDGTSQGTAIIRDLLPGPASSTIQDVTGFRGFVMFAGNGEFYRLSPNSGGITKLIDVLPGASDQVDQLTVSGDSLYFIAKPSTGVPQLYRSNSSPAGTSLVSNAPVGAIDDLKDVAGDLYFSNKDSSLWKIDHPTRQAIEIQNNNNQFQNFRDFTDANGLLYFASIGGVNVSDGTAAGTRFLGGNVDPTNLFFHNGRFFFQDGEGSSGDGRELWSTDGTAFATQVKNINPRFFEGYGYGSYPSDFHVVGGKLYFQANGGVWTSDGTEAGTVAVEAGNITDLASSGNKLFFGRRTQGLTQVEMFSRDPNAPSATSISRPGPGNGDGAPSAPVKLGNFLYFAGSDGKSGRELWRLGSNGIPQLVVDLSPGPSGSGISNLTAIDGALYFQAGNPTSGQGLWKSDGTAAGTIFLKPLTMDSFRPGEAFISVGNRIYFTAFSNGGGKEIWTSDGLPSGTFMLKDIFPGISFDPETNFSFSNSSFPDDLTPFNNQLYFTARDQEGNREIWRTDGTTTGTVLALDLFPGQSLYYPYTANGSYPQGLTTHQGKLYFAASDPNGRSLWKWDGSVAPQRLTSTEVVPHSGPTFIGNTMYFTGFTPERGTELWRSEGTPATTVIVKDVRTGPTSSGLKDLTVVDDKLFFLANSGPAGEELWRSDGTRNGTTLVSDLFPGNIGNTSAPRSSAIRELTVLNGTLFFSAETPDRGRELYRTVGSTASVTLVRDLLQGTPSSDPRELAVIGNDLYFSAFTTLGRELWKAYSPVELTISPFTASYQRGQPPTAIAGNALFADPDTTNFRGASLNITIGAGFAVGDQITFLSGNGVSVVGNRILFNNTTIGLISRTARTVQIAFNSNASATAITATIRATAFSSTSAPTTIGDRNVRFQFSDGEGGVDAALVRVGVV